MRDELSKISSYIGLALLAAIVFSGCKAYKQHYMFKVDEKTDTTYISKQITIAEKNYVIQPNDELEIKVYTNKGERIIDPNYELTIQGNQNQQYREKPEFLVLDSGQVKLPMVGFVHLAGYTLEKAERNLEKLYVKYYKDPYVRIRYLNKRVIVLGANGGKVVPLENESISLIEVIALAGGIEEGAKAQNIRLIRGNLHDPEVFIVNLSTIDGMRKSMLDVRPGDIIYIEPHKKIVTESLRDVTMVLTSLTSIITLILLVINIK